MGPLCAGLVRNRWTPWVLLGGLLLLVLLPRSGFGVPMCAFKELTGLPCPGCGLTRSLICAAHGDWPAAARMNPVGVLLFPVVPAGVFLGLLPVTRRRAVADWVEHHSLAVNGTLIALCVLLLLNGIARIAWILGGPHPSI